MGLLKPFRNRKGQALVELALSVMLLFLLVFGIVEFGRALFIYNTLNNAAREGARRAAVTPATTWNIDELKSFVIAKVPINQSDVVVNIEPATPPTGPGNIKVTATIQFRTIAGGIIPWLKDKNIRGEASFRYEL